MSKKFVYLFIFQNKSFLILQTAVYAGVAVKFVSLRNVSNSL